MLLNLTLFSLFPNDFFFLFFLIVHIMYVWVTNWWNTYKSQHTFFLCKHFIGYPIFPLFLFQKTLSSLNIFSIRSFQSKNIPSLFVTNIQMIITRFFLLSVAYATIKVNSCQKRRLLFRLRWKHWLEKITAVCNNLGYSVYILHFATMKRNHMYNMEFLFVGPEYL